MVQLGQAGDFAGARAMVIAGRGSIAMDDIRIAAAKVIDGENELLHGRSVEARATQDKTTIAGMAVALLALATLTAGLIVMARINYRLNRAIAGARQAESEREALGALTSAIFNNVPDYLIVINIEDQDRFVIADINPAFAKAMGVSSDVIRGRAIGELLPQPVAERLINHYRRVRVSDRPVTTRDDLTQFPGGPRVWESILAPVRNAEGVTDRLIGSIRDITDRVQAEERLRDAQRMEAIGQLTGGVAHDFNNLLQVIRGNLELLQRSVVGDERGQTRL
jgi:PAS domain S-box-containing protein